MINELARSLQKTEREIHRCIQELLTAGVCRRNAPDCIEIQERFWPYRRDLTHAETADSEAYVAGVRRLFLSHGCVSSSFSPADERLALSWCRRGVSLERAEHAIYLGVARKYAALLNNGKGSPITALSYFEHLIAEVAHAGVSPSYWQHVKDRTEQFERRWQTAARPKSAPPEETK